MLARIACVLLAAVGAMSSARAADLAEWPPTVCDCGSNMITIYAYEPGVVTRHWWADCVCRYVPPAQQFRQAAAPVRLPDYELTDPWRR